MTETKASRGVTEAAAAAELLRRRKARASLLDYAQYVYKGYQADGFHELVAHTLDRVVSGEIKRLFISAPPQHGKSLLTSVLLPTYWLGKRPDEPVIIASYAAPLAEAKSREARAIVEGEAYAALFGAVRATDAPVETSKASRAANEWYLAPPYRGGMRAAGVGGSLTGFPGALGIIDDPLSGWKDAQSPTVRETAWDWYRSVFRSRIWEDGAIVIIMTRWHESDLMGKLLKTQKEQWEVLRLPAIAETQEERDQSNKHLGLPIGETDPLGRAAGEALAPRRFSRATLDEIKTDVGSLIWTALYQGVPKNPEGNRFKRAWFPIVDAVPSKGQRIRYWDKAGTAEGKAGTAEGKGAATAGVLLLKGMDGLFYVEDAVQGWYSALEREKVIKQTAELDAIRYGSKSAVQIYIEQEPGSGGKESAESTIKNLAGFRIKADRPSGDKDTRLEPFAAQAEAGNVCLLRGAWNEIYIEEMVSIPNGARRDLGDATAGAFNKLNEGGTGALSAGYSGLGGRKRG